MSRIALAVARHLTRLVTYGLAGAAITVVVVFVLVLERRPDLEPWHTEHLDAEFTAASPVEDFDQYLALEERLFAQLRERVYDRLPAARRSPVKRYQSGSMADPATWPRNWNRSFRLEAAQARAGVLLVHGMSDSPYSLRSIGEQLHESGATVIGLRVPGHGTAPSGLVHVHWQDMAAAVALSMRALREDLGDRPIYVVGYSNGGALAVLHALAALEDPSLVAPRALVLISPEIGITGLAALAVWQERLGRLLGLDKLSWNSIKLEYDPFQYRSFALNAGKQAHLLTGEIQARITRLSASGHMARFPPVLTFQSVVDATVSARAVVTGLFARLPAGAHELVLFDANRRAASGMLLESDPHEQVRRLFARTDLGFAITLITNADPASAEVVARRRAAGSTAVSETPLEAAWPRTLYSLSHIALPFPPDDVTYGGEAARARGRIQLGAAVLRGETGVLRIPPADILRVHWNPFHGWMVRRMLEFLSLEDGPRPVR